MPSLATPTEIFAAVAPLADEPRAAAVFFDLDGTLAPIVARPEDSGVPSRTRELVARIAGRYGLTGVVTGRRATDARRILGLEEITYVGNHGLELLGPDATGPEPVPALAGRETVAAEFARGIESERLRRAELRTEDKGAIVALHWRGASDLGRAERTAGEIEAEAEAAGLRTHRGRMVLELRPPVDVDKGDGISAALSGSGLSAAFYAGDDLTDADGFRALAGLRAEGELERAVRVAVLSEETPADVAEAADLAVPGPEGFVAVLEALA